ncbi:hypothetical protein [Natrinema caseinilyticum]|nr:hypothetical protein [Natrinema caseinilyticum]
MTVGTVPGVGNGMVAKDLYNFEAIGSGTANPAYSPYDWRVSHDVTTGSR